MRRIGMVATALAWVTIGRAQTFSTRFGAEPVGSGREGLFGSSPATQAGTAIPAPATSNAAPPPAGDANAAFWTIPLVAVGMGLGGWAFRRRAAR